MADALWEDPRAGAVLDALGDPTRRRLLHLLRDGERTVADLTGALPVTQSAVSQHLRVLREAGLVADRPEGRRRYYRVERDGLAAVRAYVDSFWDDVLGAFAAYLDADMTDAGPVPPPDPEESR